MKRTLNFYSDPGHAWLKVKKSDLRLLNIENKITSFSYMNKENVFLEEDQDATLFYNTATNNNWKIKIKEYHTNRNSKIRSYNLYKG